MPPIADTIRAKLHLTPRRDSYTLEHSDETPTVPALLRDRYQWRIPGEELECEDAKIEFVSPLGKVAGRVYITKYRLRFEATETSQMCSFDLPLGCITKVEKIGNSKIQMPGGQEFYGLLICCKDMRDIRFASHAISHSRRPIFETLTRLAFPLTNKLPLYAYIFHQNTTLDETKKQRNGWDLYDSRRELHRLGVPNDDWIISELNYKYDFADTYPNFFAIPASAQRLGKEFLLKVGQSRSRARIPVLSWLHPNTQASITRSSQPLCGVTNQKILEDEAYLKKVLDTNADAHQLHIFDARPGVNAKLNRVKGGGYEENYDQCALHFLNIHNIHVVRDSLRKLRDSLFPKVDERNYLKMLDESKWLTHIQTIIEGSVQIADEIERNKSSVLVHCSDGWDRTAQLTALAMLQLDPYYRTIEGFAILIEKEWCSFGHKFGHRIGHGEDKYGDQERSPVFLQFIDCVYQLMTQFPAHLEFTSELLIFILDHLYSCLYGTFLYNSEKQRLHDFKCQSQTTSLWTYILENKTKFTNPFFVGSTARRLVLLMNPSIKKIKLFKEYYARHNYNVIMPASYVMHRYAAEKAVGRKTLLEELVKHKQVEATYSL